MFTQSTILVVEPDTRTRLLLKEILEEGGHRVIVSDSNESGRHEFKKHDSHLVITEARDNEAEDFQLLKDIRSISKVPIIILSSLVHEIYRIHAFELGADDYIPKPFSPRELQLRVKRLLGFYYEPSPFKVVDNYYIFPFMRVDKKNKIIEVNKKEVSLTPREFSLLLYFINNPERVISRRELLTEVWGYTYFGEERTVDVHIKKLRAKLREYSLVAPNAIVTEWKRGYRFDPNVKSQLTDL